MQSNELSEKRSLAQLVEMSVSVERALIEAGGELTPEVESLLNVVAAELPAKVDSYKAVMDRLSLAGDYYADKAKDYQTAAKSCAKAVERLKDNIKFAMRSLDAKTVEGLDNKFTLTEMASKVVLTDVVPKQFMREVTKFEPDLDAIRSALVMGDNLPFARLQEVHALRSGIRKRG